MTKLKLQIAHQVPGRIRMKIPSAKGNPELLQQISETFGVIPGVEQITVNPTTGSVVLHYDTERHDEFHDKLQQHYQAPSGLPAPQTQFDELASRIEDEAEFLAKHSETARAVVDFCKYLDREIKVATGNTVDLTIVLALGIVGLTVVEVGATAATPVWVTLSIFALNHYIATHSHSESTDDAPALAPIKFKA